MIFFQLSLYVWIWYNPTKAFLRVSVISGLLPESCTYSLLHIAIRRMRMGCAGRPVWKDPSMNSPICDKISHFLSLIRQPQRAPWTRKRTQKHWQRYLKINPKKWRTDRKMMRPPPLLPSNRKRRKKTQETQSGKIIDIILSHSATRSVTWSGHL